ncbi:MAG: response regulator transcription factor [Elusimicrobiota bacterium]|jgi:two-component system KDP operon response regulator KdpE
MSPVSRVLVVDDEVSVRAVLERILRKEGFQVLLAASAKEALQILKDQQPDVMVLDLNLPDLSGNEVCQRIRKDPLACSIPILILTGRVMEGLTAECLNSGADDYLAKPFDIKELVARVKSLLRRPRLYSSSDAVFHKGPLSLHVGERRVMVKGRPIPSLAPKEFELLRQVLLHAPKVIDKNALALAVWGVPAERLHHRTLDVHMRRIRKKIGPIAAPYLRTVPAVGYQWIEST